MRIVDTFSSFPKHTSIENLKRYYKQYPEVFHYYFSYHCANTDRRLHKALERYAANWDDMIKVHQIIKSLIITVTDTYREKYQLEFPVNVNIIAGAYGSNAYAEREIIPDITFAIERLTYETDPLSVIIAHEFGHVAHHIIADSHQIDWKLMEWDHPYVWLLQEGAATHFSKQIVPELKESIYFSYDYKGDEWLNFSRENKGDIIRCFAKDIHSGKNSGEIFKEWFSINGGSRFEFTRLAYYAADCMFQDFIREYGELETLLLWKQENFFTRVDEWLNH